MVVVLETDRLIMRSWREEDRLPFYHLNSNAEVMEYFPATFAFTQLKLEEIVAFTTISNLRSQKVMKRLDMVKDENTFLHPSLPNGHPLHEHVLYRIRQ
ncbi:MULTISPECIES: GNAT family N-acetyltransferase [Photorhabdus]|uniref:GNAT family N-acetyltransferase n=1 Tax=Photorhabdus bodei TaxID=2029681 RepID=A0AAW6BIK4_9GAMM|nr:MULTISPECIES: GNAT family N-acetyltransferase [Photorhabdus]MCT8350606.1 GNAT family N-acetyltransferase [Photorhabdus kayaii]MDB6372611.1 GNAT family N-acetyltransferase [Photorhabdus bodei]